MFGKLIDTIGNTVESFVDNPVGTVVDIATSPIVDSLGVLQGLSEGELRVYAAAARLGADVVSGMAASEIIEMLLEEYGR